METDPPENPETEPVESLKLRIGTFEFDAKGPTKTIDARLASFKELIQLAQTIAPTAAAVPVVPKTDATPAEPPSMPATIPTTSAITPEILGRVFQSKGDSLSLLAIPNDASSADALLVLLYGFAKLKDTPNVTGVSLMAAAKQSGVQVPRIDRVIDSKQEFITWGGSKRGRRYGLNNRGMKYVEDLIPRLVQ